MGCLVFCPLPIDMAEGLAHQSGKSEQYPPNAADHDATNNYQKQHQQVPFPPRLGCLLRQKGHLFRCQNPPPRGQFLTPFGCVNRPKLVLPRLYEVHHSTTALGLVNAGLGVAILPSLNLFRGVYPRICALPLVEPSVEREIGLIHIQDAVLTPATEVDGAVEAMTAGAAAATPHAGRVPRAARPRSLGPSARSQTS